VVCSPFTMQTSFKKAISTLERQRTAILLRKAP
jgi:hypothetical protein